jgi:hypothetical protein
MTDNQITISVTPADGSIRGYVVGVDIQTDDDLLNDGKINIHVERTFEDLSEAKAAMWFAVSEAKELAAKALATLAGDGAWK